MKWYIECFKRYADFNGRARRKEYWWFMVINFIIILICTIGLIVPLLKTLYANAMSGTELEAYEETDIILAVLKNPFLYIYFFYYLAVLIPGIAVTVRRLHDIGKSGFWAFLIYGGSLLGSISSVFQESNIGAYFTLVLISFAILIVSLVWMFSNSQYGPNQYGPNPKGEGNPTEESTATEVAAEE